MAGPLHGYLASVAQNLRAQKIQEALRQSLPFQWQAAGLRRPTSPLAFSRVSGKIVDTVGTH